MSTPEGLCTACSATQYCAEHEPKSGETTPSPKYIVCEGRGRLRRKTGERPIVWCVRENAPRKPLVATFPTEVEARKFAKRENADAEG